MAAGEHAPRGEKPCLWEGAGPGPGSGGRADDTQVRVQHDHSCRAGLGCIPIGRRREPQAAPEYGAESRTDTGEKLQVVTLEWLVAAVAVGLNPSPASVGVAARNHRDIADADRSHDLVPAR